MTPADFRRMLLDANVVLGPMAGVTEMPFRAICKRLGCGLTCTEMVSAKGLQHGPNSRSVRAMLSIAPQEVPCVVQLYGADPAIMGEQAAVVVERLGPGTVAAIDINMGCPVGKVVGRGEGSALMRTPALAREVVQSCVASAGVPVTVKIRSGWDDDSVNAVDFAREMEAAGAAAIAVHGRTRMQFYRGHADWGLIAAVKAAVEVPVIGSGDVMCAADARRMLDETGVDAVMVARGAQGNPWIFAEARALIDRGEVLERPSAAERIAMAREHGEALVAFGGENAYKRMCKHVVWYVWGLPGATRMRDRVFRVRSWAELDALLTEYGEYVAGRGHATA